MPRHLVVDLSSHGFGHVAQTAPVVNALRRRLPNLRLTVRGKFSAALLRNRLKGIFALIPHTNDVGMLMTSALDVRVEESAQAYKRFHALWPQRLEQESAAISALNPDLLLTNVPYISIAAAAEAGIPAVAMCSLNWADIYRRYCRHAPQAEAIHRQIAGAYGRADRFIRVTPGLPMKDVRNVLTVGPVAEVGTRRRDEIDQQFGLSRAERLVLVALGGVDTRLPIETWPFVDGIRWVIPDDWNTGRPDTLAFNRLKMSFIDMLASSDVVLTKPGYGTFVEAACNGVPVLTVERPDWPEEIYLREWLSIHGALEAIDRSRLNSGALADPLQKLLKRPLPPPVSPNGVEDAADYLALRLRE